MCTSPLWCLYKTHRSRKRVIKSPVSYCCIALLKNSIFTIYLLKNNFCFRDLEILNHFLAISAFDIRWYYSDSLNVMLLGAAPQVACSHTSSDKSAVVSSPSIVGLTQSRTSTSSLLTGRGRGKLILLSSASAVSCELKERRANWKLDFICIINSILKLRTFVKFLLPQM